MKEKDTNKEASEQMEKATESDPAKGEDLLKSEGSKTQACRLEKTHHG